MGPVLLMIITEEKWKRYIDNTGTEEERMQMLHYLQNLTHAEFEALFPEPVMRPVETMPAASARRMDLFVASLTETGKIQISTSFHLRYYWAAACIAAIAVAIWLFRDIRFRNDSQVAGTIQYDSIYNAGPNLKRITLPDSSSVWLTPSSLLQVASSYANGAREVLLEGEAYFEVQGNPHHPFVAVANGVRTQVLGTHFNIESYKDEGETRITLTEGKVAVHLPHQSPDSSWLLTPGKRLLYHHQQASVITESFTGIDEADWKSGAIVLKDLLAVEVFHRLELRFGKKIIYDPSSFGEKRFTATYKRTGIETILKNMAFIHGFAFEVKQDSIFIHPTK